MTSLKLVEAIVMENSTCLMQVEAFRKNPSDPEQVAIDLSVQVFRLPKKQRTFAQLQKELEGVFMKQLGLTGIPGVLGGMRHVVSDPAGPKEAMIKSVIVTACRKMGLKIPAAAQ